MQVQEGDGIPITCEGVLCYGADVVRPQIQMSQSVQTTQSVRGDRMDVVVAQAQVLQIFYNKLLGIMVNHRLGGMSKATLKGF